MKHLKILTSLFLLIAVFPSWHPCTAQEDESLLFTFKKHKSPVYAIAVSPDGSTIASSGEDMLIYLWDKNSGEIRFTFNAPLKPVKYLTFSRDGKYLLGAGGTEIRCWDLQEGSWTKYTKHVTHVYNLDFNQDATQFLSTSLKNKFNLWNRETATVIHAFEGHSKTSLAARFSPDNRWIASGSLDQSIIIWDATTRTPVHTMSAHGGNIFSLDFSGDSKLLVSCSMDENIKTWNVETGKIHKLFTGHDYAVVTVRFSPNARYLVSASYDGTAKLWEVATGNCIYTFVDHKDALYGAEFTPEGSQVITCSNDGTVMVYEMSPRFIAEYYYFREIEAEMERSALFNPRGKGENRDMYQARKEKAAKFRQELFEKYYLKHISDLEG